MPPGTSDITHAQHIAAWKLMLNSEAELLHTRKFRPARYDAHASGRNYTPRNILVTDDIVHGWICYVWRIPEEGGCSFVPVGNVIGDTVAPPNNSFPGTCRIPRKADSWSPTSS